MLPNLFTVNKANQTQIHLNDGLHANKNENLNMKVMLGTIYMYDFSLAFQPLPF